MRGGRFAAFFRGGEAGPSRAGIGALSWIATLQYFVAEAVVIQGWRGHYSLSARFISDLGAVGCKAAPAPCSPWHGAMNASFMLQGILIVGGAATFDAGSRRGSLTSCALALICAAGGGVFLVGLAPEDALPKAHYFGAAVNLLCCNAGMAVMGLALWGEKPPWRAVGALSIALGALGLLALGLFAAGRYCDLGVGGMERAVAYPFPLWLAVIGWLRLRGFQAAPASGP